MPDLVIQVDDLVKTYRKAAVPAVAGVSFGVRRGEFFALLGPNGAGKTTTISVLTTTLTPTSGSARVAGHDVVGDAAEVRRRVGIIFQQPSLDLNLTGEHNVRLHAILYGLAPYRPSYRAMPPSYRTSVDELAELLGIGGAIFSPVRTMSGGMKRKLEILRSLLHRPEVLFLDEPTAGLDPVSRRDLWTYLRQVQRESGTTVFLTTHYLEEAEHADQVCVIAQGKVVAEGSPSALTQRLVGRSTVVLDGPDRPALARRLEACGAVVAGGPPFEVVGDAAEVQRVISALDVPLSLVRTHVATLEDAYLDIVGAKPADEQAVPVG
jgi:ABC-2 type transport system ATP-binding protein